MNIDIQPILGLVFVHPKTGVGYGAIRRALSQTTSVLDDAPVLNSFAIDDCGNAFVLNSDGTIVFWDHEREDVTFLAANWREFVKGCQFAEPVEIDEKQVISAWIDPDFARKIGRAVPEGGWIKRPNEKRK